MIAGQKLHPLDNECFKQNSKMMDNTSSHIPPFLPPHISIYFLPSQLLLLLPTSPTSPTSPTYH